MSRGFKFVNGFCEGEFLPVELQHGCTVIFAGVRFNQGGAGGFGKFEFAGESCRGNQWWLVWVVCWVECSRGGKGEVKQKYQEDYSGIHQRPQRAISVSLVFGQ